MTTSFYPRFKLIDVVAAMKPVKVKSGVEVSSRDRCQGMSSQGNLAISFRKIAFVRSDLCMYSKLLAITEEFQWMTIGINTLTSSNRNRKRKMTSSLPDFDEER